MLTPPFAIFTLGAGEEIGWFAKAAQYIGIPGAMTVAMLFFIWKGYFVTARELTREKQALTDMAKERDFWQQIALRNLGLTERAASVAEKVVDEMGTKARNRNV